MADTSEVTIVLLKDMDDSRAEEAISVHMEAYRHDVIANNLIGGRENLRRMTSETIVRATVAKGLFYIAVDSAGAVVGTACWFPVGVDFLADEEQQEKARAADLFAALQRDEPGIHHWWMNTFLPTLSGITNKYLGGSPTKNIKMENWTLYSLSVKPSHQGRGISKKLVQVGEEQAFNQGVFTCFETDNEKNLGIYDKLGYKIAGHDFVQGPPDRPGYNLYVLYKKPSM